MAVRTTIEVTLPQMGESVTEGTILEWHKQEGDTVQADETIVEISTDKVDADVPAPASGTVVKIHVAEGDTVTVGAVLAEIAPDGDAPAAGGDGTPTASAPAREQTDGDGDAPRPRPPAATGTATGARSPPSRAAWPPRRAWTSRPWRAAGPPGA